MFSNITNILNSFRANPGETLIYLLMLTFCILFSLILHEVAHGFVALKCGDPTAKWMGRLTLNPLKHLDPIGTICMLFLRIGWARPVPINPRNFRNYRRDYILVSLAGIVTNLAIFLISTAVTVLIYKHAKAEWLGYVLQLFIMLAQMNLGLAIFNLLPVPPLDGYRFVDQFVFKGSLSMNPQTMQVIRIVFLFVCISGMLNGLLTTMNSTVFNAVFSFMYKIM
jgi:Zn-dependent protease